MADFYKLRASLERLVLASVRFGLASVANTGFGIVTFGGLLWFGAPYPIALLVSLSSGAIFNYFSHGFALYGARSIKSVRRYFVVFFCLYLLNLTILYLWGSYFDSLLVFQVLVALMLAPFAMLAIRTWVFANR